MKTKKIMSCILAFILAGILSLGIRRVVIDARTSSQKDLYSLLGTKCDIENEYGEIRKTRFSRIGTWLIRQYEWKKITPPKESSRPCYTVTIYPDYEAQPSVLEIYTDYVQTNGSYYRLTSPDGSNTVIAYMDTAFRSGK